MMRWDSSDGSFEYVPGAPTHPGERDIFQILVRTSLEDPGAATCKLANFLDQNLIKSKSL